MARGIPTQVFVPSVFETQDGTGVVVEPPRSRGEWVQAGEVLLLVRANGVNREVLAPFAGKIVRLHVDEGGSVSAGTLVADIQPGERRSPAGDGPARPPRVAGTELTPAAMTRAQLALAVIVSAVALLWPVLVLIVVLVAAGVGAAVKLRAMRAGRPSAAVGMLLGGVIRLAWFAALAAAAVAVLGGLAWLLSYGVAGLPAAARLAAFEDGPRLLAFGLALRGTRRWLAEGPRAQQLRTLAHGLPVAAAVVGLGFAVMWFVACAVLLPRRTWWPAGSFGAVTSVLSAEATDWVRQQQVNWVEHETRAVQTCLEEHSRGGWGEPAVSTRQDGSIVVSMNPAVGGSIGTRSWATLALALQNELEPQRVTVAIHPRSGALVHFDTLARARPQRDIATLLSASAPAERAAASAALKRSDLEVALRCSAAAI